MSLSWRILILKGIGDMLKTYVEVQWMILQQSEPKDYVIATGRMETVRRFCELAALELGWGTKKNRGIEWEGSGINEIGRREDNGEIVIKVDKRYYRPTEVEELCGDSTKARNELGWQPKITLEQMISEMIQEDLKIANREVNK